MAIVIMGFAALLAGVIGYSIGQSRPPNVFIVTWCGFVDSAHDTAVMAESRAAHLRKQGYISEVKPYPLQRNER